LLNATTALFSVLVTSHDVSSPFLSVVNSSLNSKSFPVGDVDVVGCVDGEVDEIVVGYVDVVGCVDGEADGTVVGDVDDVGSMDGEADGIVDGTDVVQYRFGKSSNPAHE